MLSAVPLHFMARGHTLCMTGKRSAEEECSAVVKSAFRKARSQYSYEIPCVHLTVHDTVHISGFNGSVFITDASRSGY